MPSSEIRQQFLDFFKDRGHAIVPSSSVVPVDDPTLLFTNAGMNQFKDVFLGTGTRPYKRAVDSQKCIRAGGKHNDLEDVGRDTYHHTFFEMLGNWSFGDYYKAEAIRWAWELLTKEWGLDKSRLHATVFGGDEDFGLDSDDEAFRLWTEVTDIDPGHVHRFGKKDNFWMMGETGPCGPCSEIHIDRTPDRSGGKLVNVGDARVMEIWNLVFIQYNRDDAGKLHLLPAKHVDTGMGFERITALLQGKESNYDTDVFAPIMETIGDLVKRKYSGRLDDLHDVAFRVIADHLRTLTFAITDGALPDNKGRGSVLRSVLRRAVRFGYQCFGQREPFIHKLVPAVVSHMGGAYPELKADPKRVQEIIRGEETDFLRTIERGLSLFEDAARQAEKHGGQMSGKVIFDLHTTYGFPPDLTRQMAAERSLGVDEEDYRGRLKRHEDASRGKATAAAFAPAVSGGLPLTDDRPKWCGPTGEGAVLGWTEDGQFHVEGQLPDRTEVGLLLDQTCFYAEQGGQAGDRGTIATPTGLFDVMQTVKAGAATVHIGQVTVGRGEVGQHAELTVSSEREFTRKNHTATHLLHWALRQVLGEHVEQRGSKVKPDEFTFDFSHTGPLTETEKSEVERLVNDKVYADLPVRCCELSMIEAKALPGVRAFFGDKYGDVVRVVEVGEGFSREFCGGTHLDSTGQIGFFKVLGEEAVGKGVRRLTCVTARAAVQAAQQADTILAALASSFRCKPDELPARVNALQEHITQLQTQLRSANAGAPETMVQQLLADGTDVNGTKVIAGQMVSARSGQMRSQADQLRQRAGSCVIVRGWQEEDKGNVLVAVSRDVAGKGLGAEGLLKDILGVVGGKGGGGEMMAQGAVSNPASLAVALAEVRRLMIGKLSERSAAGERAAGQIEVREAKSGRKSHGAAFDAEETAAADRRAGVDREVAREDVELAVGSAIASSAKPATAACEQSSVGGANADDMTRRCFDVAGDAAADAGTQVRPSPSFYSIRLLSQIASRNLPKYLRASNDFAGLLLAAPPFVPIDDGLKISLVTISTLMVKMTTPVNGRH